MVFKNYDMALDLVIRCSNDMDNGVLSYLSNMPVNVFNVINRMIFESDLDMEYRGEYLGNDNKKYFYCFRMLRDAFSIDINSNNMGIELSLSRMIDNETYEDMNLIVYPLVKDKYYYNKGFAMYKKRSHHKLGEKPDYSINYYTINKNNEGIIIEDDYLSCCNKIEKSGYLYYNINENLICDELYIDDLKDNKLIKKRI